MSKNLKPKNLTELKQIEKDLVYQIKYLKFFLRKEENKENPDLIIIDLIKNKIKNKIKKFSVFSSEYETVEGDIIKLKKQIITKQIKSKPKNHYLDAKMIRRINILSNNPLIDYKNDETYYIIPKKLTKSPITAPLSRTEVFRQIVYSEATDVVKAEVIAAKRKGMFQTKSNQYTIKIRFTKDYKNILRFMYKGYIFTKLEIIEGIKNSFQEFEGIQHFGHIIELQVGFVRTSQFKGKFKHTLVKAYDISQLSEDKDGNIFAPFWDIPLFKDQDYSKLIEQDAMISPNLQYIVITLYNPIEGGLLSQFNGLKKATRKFTKQEYIDNKIFIKNPKRLQRFNVTGGIALTKNTTNKDNECFFKALALSANENKRFHSYCAADFKNIRKRCNITKNTKLTLKQIETLAKYLRINIKIYTEDKLLIQHVHANKVSLETYTLYYHQNHYYYYFITDNTPKGKEYFESNKGVFHPVIIDFESIVNKIGLLNTYSASILPWSLNKAHFMIDEPDSDNIMKQVNDYLISVYNFINQDYKTQLKFLEFNNVKDPKEYVKNHKIKLILIAHNGDKFDFLLFADYLARKCKYNVNISFGTNQVRNIKTFYIGGTFDTVKLITCSLKNACRDFGISKKLSKNAGKEEDFDHKDIQRIYEKHGIKGVIEQKGKEIEEYNNLDVISLKEIVKKLISVNEAISEKCGIPCSNMDIFQLKTIGALTRYKCNLLKAKNKIDIPGIVKSYTLYKKYRRALIGGRTQIFRKNYVPGSILEFYASIDVVSLYPTVMTKEYYYPVGACIETTVYNPDRLGIYRCTNINQSHLKHPIIPSYNTQGVLDWNTDVGLREKMLTSVDIEELKKYDCDVTVNEGIYWLKKDNRYFGEYIEKLYTFKKEQDILKKANSPNYNSALRQFIKILMNSLYGKSIEKVHKEYREMISNMGKIPIIANKCNIDTKINLDFTRYIFEGKIKENYINENWVKKYSKKHTFAGLFVLAYSRAYMYKFIHLLKDDVVYQDTDSLHIPETVWKEFKIRYPELIPGKDGKKLGQFENEFEDYKELKDGNKCSYFAKKLYSISDMDLNPIKYKAKGISFNNNTYFYRKLDKKYLTKEEIKEYDGKTYQEKVDNKLKTYIIKSNTSEKVLAKENIKEFFNKFRKEKKIDVYSTLLKRFTNINVNGNIAVCKLAEYTMKKTIKY